MVGPEAPKIKGAVQMKQDSNGTWVPDDNPTAAAYAEMERRETEEIIRGLTGQEIQAYLYDIPFKDEKRGVVECNTPGYCKYRERKIKHVHVQGVGAEGMDEIARIYEGVQAVNVGQTQRIHRNGRYYYVAHAVALDCITGNMRTASAEQPETEADVRSGKDARASFAPRIAERKAIRNAIGAILPRPLINKLKEWAAEGKQTFSPAEAERLITALGVSRRNRPMRCLLNPVTGLPAVAVNPNVNMLAAVPSAPQALPAQDLGALPPAEPAPEAPAQKPERPRGRRGGRKISSKQLKMLYAVRMEKGVPEDVYREYLSENFGVASDKDLSMSDVDAVRSWLEHYPAAGAQFEPGDDDGIDFHGVTDEDIQF